jgi:DNA-binding transcriptional LysR family regulator
MMYALVIRNTNEVDPHLLRTFVAVARCGSFSAAARQLGYTQSAVSQHVAALESDLGAILLHRRPVAPTEAGARLLDHAAPILLRLDAARADVARLAGTPQDRLLVGLSPLAATAHGRAATSAVAEAIGAVRRSIPRLEVTVRVIDRAAVVVGVATGEFDLGLVDGVAAPTDPLRLSDVSTLSAVAVAEEPIAVALPAGHPLARRRGLRLEDLVDARWIDAPEVGAPLADLRAAVGSDGMPASLRYEGTDTATLLALVAAGNGLAVLPGRVAEGRAGIAAVPVVSPRLMHRTELLHGTITGTAAKALTATLTG